MGTEGVKPQRGNRVAERTHRRPALLGPGLWVNGAGVGDCRAASSSAREDFPMERGPEMTQMGETPSYCVDQHRADLGTRKGPGRWLSEVPVP